MKYDDLLVWLLSVAAGLAVCGARLGRSLYRLSALPPVDPEALRLWKLKRRWLVWSEVSALPAFASISVVVGRLWHWPIEGVVALSMALGAVGVAFALDAFQTLVSRKLSLPEGVEHD